VVHVRYLPARPDFVSAVVLIGCGWLHRSDFHFEAAVSEFDIDVIDRGSERSAVVAVATDFDLFSDQTRFSKSIETSIYGRSGGSGLVRDRSRRLRFVSNCSEKFVDVAVTEEFDQRLGRRGRISRLHWQTRGLWRVFCLRHLKSLPGHFPPDCWKVSATCVVAAV